MNKCSNIKCNMINFTQPCMFTKDNTIHGIEDAFKIFDVVGIDVMFDGRDHIVICNDHIQCNDSTNHRLQSLLSLSKSMYLMINIKGFGIRSAKDLATKMCKYISLYNQHKYLLCSFNEYCVQELIELRQLYDLSFDLGVMSSGIPIGLFDHLPEIDFVALDHNIVDEDVVEKIRYTQKKVYIRCNEKERNFVMIHKYRVDGIILT